MTRSLFVPVLLTAVGLVASFVALPGHAQVFVPPRAYTLSDASVAGQIDLATLDGRFTIELGPGCGDIVSGINVEFLPGSGGVAGIKLVGSDQVCNVLIDQRLSDTPCAQIDGVCDVSEES